MPDDAMIRHLFRAISPTSWASFPHGLTNIDKVVEVLLENAKLSDGVDDQKESLQQHWRTDEIAQGLEGGV